jgi:hypothetical protein
MSDAETKATRRHYTKDRKELVVFQHEKRGKTPKEIADDLDMFLRVVQRVL